MYAEVRQFSVLLTSQEAMELWRLLNLMDWDNLIGDLTKTNTYSRTQIDQTVETGRKFMDVLSQITRR